MTSASRKPSQPEKLGAIPPSPVDHDDRLILWMLKLTPTERLEALQSFAQGVGALRHARKVT